MIYPPMAELLENVDSRYTLAIEIAKRARQLTAGSESRTEFKSKKNVSIAVNEIYEGKVKCVHKEEGKE